MTVQVQALAERVCRSETFRSTKRLQEFFRYLVKRQAVDGIAKETLIGVEFFNRKPGYDPRRDPIVRVEAHRLRRRLSEYYQNEGRDELLQVDLPLGAYRPVLRRREERASVCRLAVRVQAQDDVTAEGLTAELIRSLGALHGIQVLATSSALIAQHPRQAAEDLGANTFLDCRFDGSNLQATLSRLRDGELRPVGKFDNLIQPAVDALTQFVAANIGVQRRRQTTERAAIDLGSYQTYLAGRAWFHRWSGENLLKAEDCFQQVLDRHPTFAPAYSGLADVQVLRAYWQTPDPRSVLERGLRYAHKAVELDDASGDAQCSRGALEAVLNHNWERAEVDFRAALDANASNALALNWLAIIALVPQLRFAEAVDAVFAAYDLDPASPEIGNEIVWVRICCGQFSEAAEQARLIRDLYPGFLENYWSLAVSESCCGRHESACAALADADRLHPDIPMTLALRCFVEGRRRNFEGGRAALARLESLNDPLAARAIYRAWAHAAIGDLDRGFRYLEEAVDAADPHALYMQVFPPNEPLRSHPAYPEIVRRQRLPASEVSPVATSC
jgi:tetratricopeptide (TPR) repeat protein